MAAYLSSVDAWTYAMQLDCYKNFEKELEKQIMESYTLRGLLPSTYISKMENCISWEIKKPYVEDYIPKQVFFNGKNTTCVWKDDSKTTVHVTDSDVFTEEHGVAMCIVKKLFKNRQEFLHLIKNATRQLSKEEKLAKRAAKSKK